MNLSHLLNARAAAGRPVRIALIGAGKFGSMFLSQVRRTPGLHLTGVADLSHNRAGAALEKVGWPAEQYAARSLADALKTGGTFLTEDSESLIAAQEIDVVIE